MRSEYIPDGYIQSRVKVKKKKGEDQVSSFYHAVFLEKIVQAEQSAVIGELLGVEKEIHPVYVLHRLDVKK